MKVCQKCGATCADNAVFCGNCGNNFVSDPNATYSKWSDYNGTGFYQNSTSRNNPLAVASMVLGIISVVFSCCYGFGGIPGVLAIIFGAVSRSSIKKSDGRETGLGFSTAGLVLGIISVSIAVAIILLLVLGISAATLLNPSNLNGAQFNG